MRTLIAIAAATLTLTIGHALAGDVFIITFTLSVDSQQMAVGELRPAALRVSDVGPRAFGGWDIKVHYDPSVVSAVDCAHVDNSVCNVAYARDAVHVVGASARGITRETTLAIIVFECRADGVSPVTLEYDGGVGIGLPKPTLIDSTITCAESVEPAATPSSTPLPALPATGSGAASEGALPLTLLAGVLLAAAGTATLSTALFRRAHH